MKINRNAMMHIKKARDSYRRARTEMAMAAICLRDDGRTKDAAVIAHAADRVSVAAQRMLDDLHL
jgi:hypothetical protein